LQDMGKISKKKIMNSSAGFHANPVARSEDPNEENACRKAGAQIMYTEIHFFCYEQILLKIY
jgi:hypothetical protein